MDKMIGSVLNGRYLIQEVVGVGGMAVVYKAKDVLENRWVAVKVLKDEYLKDEKFRRRFFNESRAIAILSHPNIVDVYDVNFEGDEQYIVMEYVDGQTLKDRMVQTGPLSMDEAVNYMRQILSALQHAHERGVIHRDIKPHNIMLLPDGTLKVADFGIAHVSNFDTVTMSELAIGSVHYISPEQAKGQATDEKSDLYSVGVILYEMMTGALPFDADSPVTVALMQVQNKPRDPSELRPDLPAGMRQIILKAMAKQPENRYQNAETMLDDLMRLDIDPSVTFDYTEEDAALPEPDPVSPAPEEKGKKKKEKKNSPNAWKEKYIRNNILAVVAGFLLAIIVVLAGIGGMVTIVSDLHQEYVTVPALVGREYRAVELDASLSRNFTITAEYRNDNNIAAGIIISQYPEEGEQTINGKEITVVVSLGQRMVTVPSVTGMTELQATAVLKNNGLIARKVSEVGSVTQDEGTILRVSPGEGESVPEGSTVTIYVNVRAAATQVRVPGMLGKTREEALSLLYQAGLNNFSFVEVYSDEVAAGRIVSQSAAEDEVVDVSTLIVLTVSLGGRPVE